MKDYNYVTQKCRMKDWVGVYTYIEMHQKNASGKMLLTFESIYWK